MPIIINDVMRLKYRVCFCLLWLLFIVACSREGQEPSYVDIVPERLNIAEDLSIYQLVSVSDTSLIATSLSPGGFLFRIPIDGVSVGVPFLKTGRGPYEVPAYCPVVCYDDTVHVLYSSMGSFNSLRIPLSGMDDCSKWVVSESSSKDATVLGMSMTVMKSKGYLTSSSILNDDGDKSVLHLVSEDLSSVESIPFWPEDGYAGPVIPKKSMYLNSKIRANGSKVLYVADEGKYAAILDIGKSPVSETLIYSDYPSYTATPDGFNWRRTPGSPLGCYAFATDNRIYLAASKAKFVDGEYQPKDIKGYPPYYVDEVDVFDWEGKYIHTLRSNIPFSGFWIDDNDSAMYFLTINLGSSVSEVYRCCLE